MCHRSENTVGLALDGLASDERLGWVSSAGEVGDEVCILFGAKVTFVIRKVETANHNLIGGLPLVSLRLCRD